MRGAGIALVLVLAGAAPAAADSECAEWIRLGPGEKSARIQAMIEGHLNSNVGKRYTSENTVAMRRCLNAFARQIEEEIDGECAKGNRAAMGAVDDLFDRYFLSCVQ